VRARARTGDEISHLVEDCGGDRPHGCEWYESACTRTPTHRVVHGDHGMSGEDVDPAPSETMVFCVRHYVLHLALLLETHLPDCPIPVRDHVLAYGSGA
jgi:hypothetical protein